jgi:hypothetical protein
MSPFRSSKLQQRVVTLRDLKFTIFSDDDIPHTIVNAVKVYLWKNPPRKEFSVTIRRYPGGISYLQTAYNDDTTFYTVNFLESVDTEEETVIVVISSPRGIEFETILIQKPSVRRRQG